MENQLLIKALAPCFILLSVFFIPVSAQTGKGTYRVTRQGNGLLLQSSQGYLRVEFTDAAIVRVRYVREGDFKDNGTGACIAQSTHSVDFTVKETLWDVILESRSLRVSVKKATGCISYYDKSGRLLLTEGKTAPRTAEKIELRKVTFNDSAGKVLKTANGDQLTANITETTVSGSAWKMAQHWVWQPGEALYGLGSHQEDYMNLRGTRQYLYEHNLKKSMPVLMSTMGYGLFVDAGCAMIFHDDSVGSFMEMESVNQLDYYFMFGPQLDRVVSRFRSLTGKVELPPRYMFGYIQSKERYSHQSEVDSVLGRFRSSHIPIDVIVQDWLYWNDGFWGYKKFDEKKYPNPSALIDEVHRNHAHFMLSVWPNLSGDEVPAMKEKGFVLGRNIYDAFNPDARSMYWNAFVDRNLFSKGVDAWWCDASEPIDDDWNKNANNIANDQAARFGKNVGVMADLLGSMRVNTFSLHHTMGVYENQRKTGSNKRVVILTRASFPGQQRYGTMVWNGDTKATWADFKSWIPSGLNYMATGSPYWTIDAGAFFIRPNDTWFHNGGFPDGPADSGYCEFYVRNLQYAGWLPIFRSHGTDFAREPWQFGKPGQAFYDAILKQINLRYRLLPYIYSSAALVTFRDYTLTRPLVFDFQKDTTAFDIKDEFLFGPSFLVCPVTDPMYYKPQSVRLENAPVSRRVYLPGKGKWVDFWTGNVVQGGQTVMADAPIDHIPVYVKAGAIVPMGPLVEYSSQDTNAPLEIRIYPGSNGRFTYYEDAGDGYGYQKGEYASFEMTWDNEKQILTISKRTGTFNGMTKVRKVNLVLIKPGMTAGMQELTGRSITYSGEPVRIRL